MAAQSSTVRPSTWASQLGSLVPLTTTLALFWVLGDDPNRSLLAGALVFLLYRYFVVRRILLKDHRLGIVSVRAGRFEDGLEAFRRSEAAWAKRPTIDRHRAVLLGSAAAYSFHALARYNQAYALSRLGRGEDALELLDAVLRESPAMVIARELRDVLLAGSRLHPDIGRAMSDEPDTTSGRST